MQNGGYTIGTKTREKVDMAVEWAAIEGWNPGLHDADHHASMDPKGFLIGLLHNEPIATISAVKYGQSFGFVGFYTVKPGKNGVSKEWCQGQFGHACGRLKLSLTPLCFSSAFPATRAPRRMALA